jgi:tungstate transport system substrate-binding protein
VIVVNPDRNPKINRAGAERFRQFVLAKDTLQFISTFGKDKYGQALFVPNPD